MDKYEYRVKTEQMMEHVEKKQYKKAMEIADTIDWRRVKNTTMLNTVSEIYESNGEFQKSRDILFMAFDRAPSSRKIVYRLGILALKIQDTEEASDCYEEFVKLAPKDPNQYILKYKILKAQGSPLSEQISALSEFKKAEYVEKWAYELAKLYHEAGMTAECLEECDDLILWFSEGKYVYQAMELKMQYKPLTPLQQEKYDSYGGKKSVRIRKPQAVSRPVPKKEDPSAQRPMVKSVPSTTAVFSDLPEEVLSSSEEHSEEAEEGTQPEETRKFPTGELTKALAAMEAKNEKIQEADVEESAVAAVAEENKIDKAGEERKIPITTVVKGATLEEALANGVAVANGINREEKRRMEQREEEIRISGQMKIEDILQEWEEKQKLNAEAIEEQRVKDEERLRKEREEREARREAQRIEAERLEAEAVARRKAEAEEAARKEAEQKAAEEEARKEAERKAAEEEARKEAERKAAEEEARKKKAVGKVKKAPVLSDDIRQLVEELEGKVAEEENSETAGTEESEDNYQMELDFLMDEDEETASDEDTFSDAIEELDFESGDGFDDGSYEEKETVAAEEDLEEIGEDLSEEDSEEDFSEEDYEEAEEDSEEADYEETEEDFEEADYEEAEEDFEEADYEEAEEDSEEEDYEETEEDLGEELDEAEFDEEEFDEAEFDEEEFDEEELDEAESDEEEFDEEEFDEEEFDEEEFDEAEFDEEEFDEAEFDEEEFDEAEFDEAEFSEEDFEEEELEEEEFEEEELDEEEFDEDEFEEEDFFEEEELPQVKKTEKEAPLEIEEPSEEEIQKRIKKSKGSGVPFDTGFVVTGRYDLSATSEIGLKAGLTEEQKKLFSYFVPVRGMSEQIVEALDNDRRAQREGTSKTGNLLVIGRKGSGKTVLAVDIVKAIQKQRNLKQGKVAIVTGESLNKKELPNIIQKLRGGAIIIEKAGKLNSRTIKELSLLMEKKTGEMLFVLEDQRKPLERILTAHPDFKKKFTSRLELPVFINDELVTFGQTYAKENGYKLDEMGILALYSRIDVMQREDHAVTVAEVKDIMDEAIAHSQKANVKHLARRMFGKSTDSSDRIILKEEDFKI